MSRRQPKHWPHDFNPRSLTGATPAPGECEFRYEFQSTLPHGSDLKQSIGSARGAISIHAPSRERRSNSFAYIIICDFNPRSLTGATIFFCFTIKFFMISIHAPSRERLCQDTDASNRVHISIHAPSRERLIRNQ